MEHELESEASNFDTGVAEHQCIRIYVSISVALNFGYLNCTRVVWRPRVPIDIRNVTLLSVQLLTDKKGQWCNNIIDNSSHEEPRIYVTMICSSFLLNQLRKGRPDSRFCVTVLSIGLNRK